MKIHEPGMALLLAFASAASAQQSDVTFFVIGKHANFSQSATGDLQPVDYSFFSEIFLTADGDAGDATLTFPTGERVTYEDMRDAQGGDRDNILLVAGEDRFTTLGALDGRYPDGRYEVSFSTPGGSVQAGVLVFENRGLPRPPQIAVSQDGAVNCARLRPGRDAVVRWGPFEQGRADPNGILDDLVFVILTDSNGLRVAHSGRPFEGGPYLTYADAEFTIDGGALRPGTAYTLSVEHAILDDTRRFGGVPAFTTRAVTTKLDITTTESTSDDMNCGAPAPVLSHQPRGAALE